MDLGIVNSLKRKFETLFNFSDDDGHGESCNEVTKEVREWLDLSKCKLKPFINEKGLLDEFLGKEGDRVALPLIHRGHVAHPNQGQQ